MVFYVLLAILLFGVLIAVHEWGHFITAKLLGVRVNEFSIGMGPVIWKTQKGETQYSLRAVPMGGFCAMEGEDDDSESPDSFGRKPLWRKLIILCAGSFMNLVAGLLILLVLLSQSTSFALPVISHFADEFPLQSEEALLPGDRIVSIDGRKVHFYDDIQLYFSISNGETMDIVVERNGALLERSNLPLVPREYTENGETKYRYGITFQQTAATPGMVLKQSWDTTWYFARSVWLGFSMLFQGDAGVGDLAGPVGIISMIGESGSSADSIGQGIYFVFYIIALVAVNLAIVNMLPIPALDGGRVFLLLINKGYYLFTRRNINPKYEAYIHGIGFALLILLMIVVTFQDVIKLVISP